MVRKSVSTGYFQFTRPFTSDVWMALAAVMFSSAIYIYVMDKWNPFKDNIQPETRFTGQESFWHSYLIITQVGAPFGASVYPTRVFSVFYWFFALVVVGCYTGNLAGFLSESEKRMPNIPWDDLGQSSFRFGMLRNSSLSSEWSQGLYSQTLYSLIEQRGDFVANYSEGVRRVKEENFILFGTSIVMTSYRSK